MRSYAAARNYFSILEFVSWCIIVLGGIVAIGAIAAIGQMSRSFGGSSMAGLAGLIPGVAVMFAGFMGLVLAQIGRAGVDSAEYGQQSLQISREQLEISKQGMRAGRETDPSFATLNAAKDELRKGSDSHPNVSFGSAKADTQATTIRAEPTFSKKPVNEVVKLNDDGSLLEYRGRQIVFENGKYTMNGIGFSNLDRAKKYIDQLKIPVK